MRVFPGDTTNGIIVGLDPSLDYLFSISVSYNINGMTFEGQRSQPIPTGMRHGYFQYFILSLGVTLTPTIVSSSSKTVMTTGKTRLTFYFHICTCVILTSISSTMGSTQ